MPKKQDKKTAKKEVVRTQKNSTDVENVKDKSLNFRETLSTAVENFSSQPLSYIEGFLSRREVTDSFNEMVDALALYEVKHRELYREAGFKNFADYCESRGISKSLGYAWAKHVEEIGPDSFPALAEKVGLNRTFFRAFALIPHEIQQAVVKGNKIEVDGKEYDFSADGESVKQIVIGLVKYAEKQKEEASKELQEKDKKLRLLETEKNNLQRILDEFNELIPDSVGETKWAKSRALASALYDKFDSVMSFIIFEQLDLNDGSGVAALEADLQRMYSRITHKMEELQKYKRGEAR
ncbi:MAG: hypothetical protein AB1553_00395 [Nitrospirota bacterium]